MEHGAAEHALHPVVGHGHGLAVVLSEVGVVEQPAGAGIRKRVRGRFRTGGGDVQRQDRRQRAISDEHAADGVRHPHRKRQYHSNADGHAHSHSNADGHTHGHSNANGHTHGHGYSNADDRANRRAYPHANGNRYLHTHGDAQTNGNRYLHTHIHANGHGDASTDSDGHPYAHGYIRSDVHGNRYPHARGYVHSCAYGYRADPGGCFRDSNAVGSTAGSRRWTEHGCDHRGGSPGGDCGGGNCRRVRNEGRVRRGVGSRLRGNDGVRVRE